MLLEGRASPSVYTLSLHDALPIWLSARPAADAHHRGAAEGDRRREGGLYRARRRVRSDQGRSEEHTSELQSRLHLVCRLLLEKKKHWPPTLTQRRCVAPRARGSVV